GIILTGRMVDRVAGRALRAKHVGYQTLPTNPVREFVTLTSSGIIDPAFKVTVPPGGGMLFANIRGPNRLYTRARLRKEDKGSGLGGPGDGETYTMPLNAYHPYRMLDIPADATAMTLELELTHGLTPQG